MGKRFIIVLIESLIRCHMFPHIFQNLFTFSTTSQQSLGSRVVHAFPFSGTKNNWIICIGILGKPVLSCVHFLPVAPYAHIITTGCLLSLEFKLLICTSHWIRASAKCHKCKDHVNGTRLAAAGYDGPTVRDF